MTRETWRGEDEPGAILFFLSSGGCGAEVNWRLFRMLHVYFVGLFGFLGPLNGLSAREACKCCCFPSYNCGGFRGAEVEWRIFPTLHLQFWFPEYERSFNKAHTCGV